MPSKNRSRNFAFTYHAGNDYIEECEEKLLTLPCDYLIFQYEMGKQDDRVHIQGFCSFKNKIAFSTIHVYCPGIHVESAKATALKNIAYCTKLDTRVAGPYEHGERPCQGYRSDLVVMGEMVKNGIPVRKVIAEVGMGAARMSKHLMTYAQSLYPERDRNVQPKVYIRWGPANSGKTRPIWEKYGDDQVYQPVYQKGTVWWDNYVGQQCVLMDDWPWETNTDLYHDLLRWTDRYRQPLNVKGGSCVMGNSDFYLTSNVNPDLWFGGAGLRALARRITQIEEIVIP